MRIWIAAIGARPRDAFDSLFRLYLDRIAPYLPAGAKTGPKSTAKSAAKSAIEAPLFRSEEAFWEAIDRERARTAPLLVLLDEHGRQMGSEAFAAWLGRERDSGRQLIIFAIGPADGWSRPHTRPDAALLSLGPMTLPHELARVVLAEQIYRALTILRGHPYHRS